MKVYNFFKVGGHYEYIKDQKITYLTTKQFDCMANQYKLMGYMKVNDNNMVVSFAKDEKEIENFLKKISEKC